MKEVNPVEYERGAWLNIRMSQAVLELDQAVIGKPTNYYHTNKIKSYIQGHYQESKEKNSLGYNLEQAFISALVFDVIPKIFNMNPKNTKKYEIEDYLAGLELILEQFQDIEKADTQRLEFLRKFMVDLLGYKISRVEHHNYDCFARI